MGHIRLGRLPKTKPWKAVFEVLESDQIEGQSVAGAVASAAQKELKSFAYDPGLNYVFWVLARIATASRADDFTDQLRNLGIQSDDIRSGIHFVKRVAQAVEQELRKRSQRSFLVQMAELSLRDVLSAAIIQQSSSLFGTEIADIQLACRGFSTRTKFGGIARRFFATLMNRFFLFITDKEISNYVDSSRRLSSPDGVLSFQSSMRTYCFESAKIVEDFAGGWLSKQNWETNNDIPERSAAAFTAYAIEKLSQEIRSSAG